MPRIRRTPADIEIGQRIREARQQRSLSQTAIARVIGTKYQQVQRLENGTNRLYALDLARIAAATQQPMEFFLKGTVADVG